MQITKQQLKQLIKEEYSNLVEDDPLDEPLDDPLAATGVEDEPSMSTGPKLNEILRILRLAFPEHSNL